MPDLGKFGKSSRNQSAQIGRTWTGITGVEGLANWQKAGA